MMATHKEAFKFEPSLSELIANGTHKAPDFTQRDRLLEYMYDRKPEGMNINICYLNGRGGDPVCYLNQTQCHSGLAHTGSSEWVGSMPTVYANDKAQAFLSWLFGPDSVYLPILNYLGDDYFKVVRDKKGLIKGCLTSTDISFKPLFNFYKAQRTVSEHGSDVLPFWDKWHVGNGTHPGVTFLLSYFFSTSGQKYYKSHSVLDKNWGINPVSLKRFFNNKHNYWNLGMGSREKSYNGENADNWGPAKGERGFKLHENMPNRHESNVETIFHKLYYSKPPTKLDDLDFKFFFDNLESIVKEYS